MSQSGWIILDKDSGLFSRTAGGRIARMLGTKKFGHIGTLDPMATGVLPLFLPYTSWGLIAGCLLANLFSTVTALDIVVGTAATALSCLLVVRWRKTWVAILAPVVCNGLLVGAMLSWVYLPAAQFLYGLALYGAEVAAGELTVMLALGLPLQLVLRRTGLCRSWE